MAATTVTNAKTRSQLLLTPRFHSLLRGAHCELDTAILLAFEQALVA